MRKLCRISCKFDSPSPKSLHKNGGAQSLFRCFTASSSSPLDHPEEEHYPIISSNRRTQRHYLSKLLFSLSKESASSASHYKEIHGQVILSGFESNPFLNNILIQSYSIAGCLDYARKVFDKMPKRDMISWSSVITMYTQHGFYEESLLVFSELRSGCEEEDPNEFVLASVVSCCGRLGSLVKGAQLHCFVVKDGFDQFVYVGTSLIDFYSKGGDVGAARRIFNDLSVKSTATWTAIIAACVNAGKSEISLQLLRNMLETDVVPDNYVVSSILGACSSFEYLEGGKEIHAYVLRRGAEMDVTVSNVLIDFYMKCGKVKTARTVFDQMEFKNTISWTTMISGYMQNSSDWEAISMFRDMNSFGWMLDRFACSSVLISCGSLETLDLGRQVHAYTVKANVDSDGFVKNSLIDMYAKCDSFGDARKVFEIMVNHDVISYNAIIEGCLQDRLYEAFDLFAEMRENLILPSLLTFVSLLGASASLFSLELSKQLHGLTIKFGFSADMFVCSILIDVYSKCSSIKDARQVFIEMNAKDIVVWNSMLFGYTQQCENEEALKLFLELQQSWQKPNALTFVALIAASCNLVSLLHGLQFHNQIVKVGLDFDPHVTNALVDMYSKCGSLEEAQRMFSSTLQRDIACWNSMISTYAQHGEAKEALNMFEKMINDGLKPNNVTFVGVLSACSHVGLVKEGLHHFYSMSGYGIEPETEHYVCMVSLLGRAGKLVEAMEFIENMPIPPAAIVWRSLLSACREAGHIDLGKYAASMAISIDPKDSGSYILLSNIYASKGMWINVKKLREKMVSNGVVKETGCSWIEINNEVHLFIARDRNHHQTDLIYSFMELLIQHMKGIGYVPEDTTFSNE